MENLFGKDKLTIVDAAFLFFTDQFYVIPAIN